MPHGDGATPAKKSVIYIELQKLFPVAEKRAIDDMVSDVMERVSGMGPTQMKEALKEILPGIPESAVEAIADAIIDKKILDTSWSGKVTKIISETEITGPITTIEIPDMENLNSEEIYSKMRLLTKIILQEWLKRAKDPKNKAISLKKLRPALAIAYSKSTNRFYIARNLTRTEVDGTEVLQKGNKRIEIVDHPYVAERQQKLNSEENKTILESYNNMTVGAGTHAECLAFNQALIDTDSMGKSPKPDDIIINVVHSDENGRMFERCPHCRFITYEADLLPELREHENKVYANDPVYKNLDFGG